MTVKETQQLEALIVLKTTSYTLALTDLGYCLRMDSASDTQVTLPLNATVALPIGYWVSIRQVGVGATTLNLPVGVSINGNEAIGQNKAVVVMKIDVNEWDVYGGSVLASLTELENKVFTDSSGWTLAGNGVITDDGGTNKLRLTNSPPSYCFKDIFVPGDLLRITINAHVITPGAVIVASSTGTQDSNVITNGLNIFDNIDTTGFGDGIIVLKADTGTNFCYVENILVEKY